MNEDMPSGQPSALPSSEQDDKTCKHENRRLVDFTKSMELEEHGIDLIAHYHYQCPDCEIRWTEKATIPFEKVYPQVDW